jgi:hypothetical protein
MGRLGKAMVFVGAVAMLATVVPDAEAASVRVRCEKRTERPRSKISVDGNNLATGNYTARATSGPNIAVTAPKPTVGDEVEFDFDSRRGDIRRGATPIARDFIVGPVTGEILDAQGVVVASDTVNCRRR